MGWWPCLQCCDRGCMIFEDDFNGPDTLIVSVASGGTFGVTGYNATVVVGPTIITATLGALSIVGYNATVVFEVTVTATLGSLSIVGYNATVTQEHVIDSTLGTMTITGFDVEVDTGCLIFADPFD